MPTPNETDPSAPNAPPPAALAARRAADQALASSVPDDNSILKLMLEMLLGQKGLAGFAAVPGAITIMLVYVVSKWGVAAILAVQTLILQIHEDNMSVTAADRSVQAAQVKATEDVITALSGVTEAVRGLAGDVKGLAGEVVTIRADVNQIKQDRLSDNRKLSAIAAEQQRLKGQPQVR